MNVEIAPNIVAEHADFVASAPPKMDFFCDKQHPVVPVTLLFIQRERFVLLEGDAFVEGLGAFVALGDEV